MWSVASTLLQRSLPKQGSSRDSCRHCPQPKERQVMEPEARPRGAVSRWFDWGMFLWKLVAAQALSQGLEVTYLFLPRPLF